MRYLGVDPGGKRMGFAVGDSITGVAVPLEVVPYPGAKAAARVIRAKAAAHGAQRVVLGLPSDEDGGRTDACRRSEAVAEALAQLEVEVVMQPEFLSTNEARRRAREAGLKRNHPIDHLAAQVLLEEFLAVEHENGPL